MQVARLEQKTAKTPFLQPLQPGAHDKFSSWHCKKLDLFPSGYENSERYTTARAVSASHNSEKTLATTGTEAEAEDVNWA